MPLDLYTGPISRYALGDWVRPGASEPEHVPAGPHEAQDMQREVQAWQAKVCDRLAKRHDVQLTWDDDPSADYVTAALGWIPFFNVLALAAREELFAVPAPELAVTDPEEDHAVAAVLGNPERSRYAQLILPQLWLPHDANLAFQAAHLSGEPEYVGGTAILLQRLTELNERTLEGTPDDLEAWRALPPPDRSSTYVEAARFGVATWIALARVAVESGQPLLIDS